MTPWHGLPAEVYRLVEHVPGSVLLESAAEPESAEPPPSRLFVSPTQVLTASQPDDLRGLFTAIESAVDAGLYVAGYFTYECGAYFEPAVGPVPQDVGPLAWFGVYQREHLFDHRSGVFVDDAPEELAQFREALPMPPEPSSLHDPLALLTMAEYAEKIVQIHELIRAGDVYQLNFTMPMAMRAEGSAATLYKRLRARQPAPYSAFLHTQPNQRILSFSPELFFRVDTVPAVTHPCDPSSSQGEGSTKLNRRITTRPMKGTAPRGRTTAEDEAQAAWLAADAKNRAENVMIVDLIRNDLGRLCAFGSVQVENLFAVERYPTLWQMTSTVSGDLRPGVSFEQIFRALFPSGSVTGAPKVRAMQCIHQLEGRPRGVYTGAIGCFSSERTVFNVAIRTLAADGNGSARMGVGSGIVIDSEAGEEWRECQLKARFLMDDARGAGQASPAAFSLIETLLWKGSYPLLTLHLDRLEDSARYFGFACDRTAAIAALEAHAAGFVLDQPAAHGASSSPHPFAECGGERDSQPLPSRRVRLLVDSNGSIEVGSALVSAPATQLLRVRIAPGQTDSRDPFYFHKTTHRPVYATALQAAQEAGFDDVLFLNERGEVTEGAIHNIFIQSAGKLITPPIQCGLLAGVERRHILATDANAAEHVLTLQDLRAAEAIYLSNAVRGLRPAIIVWDTDR